MRIRSSAWFLMFAGAMMGQTLDNQTLKGKFFFRHVLFTTDTSENITDIRSLSGTITFGGDGTFTFNGQQTAGTNAPAALSGPGQYTVSPAGIISLTNPQDTSLTVNARYGVVSTNEPMVIGSSTEATGNTFDLLIAVAAPSGLTFDSALSGSYFVATLSFPAGSGTAVRDTLFNLTANGQGGFNPITVAGHAANLSNGAPTTQTVAGASYVIHTDGSGSATFPLTADVPEDQLLTGDEAIYLSSNGDVILGGSTDAGVHDVLIGFKAAASSPAWSSFFWNAGLRYESAGFAAAYSGALYSTGDGTLTLTRRLRQLQPSGAITYDFTGANTYALQSDGTGTAGLTGVALGASGNGLVGASTSADDSGGYELELGIRMPSFSGTGVFLGPQAVDNGASFAPPGNPIAPGEFITLFGSDLAPGTQTATPPYQPSLGGVSVSINGLPAPIYLISSGQINALVPYATTGPTATITVNNNGTLSNTVEVPVAATAPGVFSAPGNGLGPGAILHADYTLVDAAKPAKAGEPVLVFLTGLGAVTPPVADGTAGSATTLSHTVAQVNVLIGGIPATVSYAGLAPGFPGLYQVNVAVPNDLVVTASGPVPLAIQTPESFNDQVDIIVSP